MPIMSFMFFKSPGGMIFSAFNMCSSITKILIPNSVKTIGTECFCKCIALKSITLSNSFNTLESRTFKECSVLESIIIPDELSIPDSVECIGSKCFNPLKI